jgi:hypothetical protein
MNVSLRTIPSRQRTRETAETRYPLAQNLRVVLLDSTIFILTSKQFSAMLEIMSTRKAKGYFQKQLLLVGTIALLVGMPSRVVCKDEE